MISFLNIILVGLTAGMLLAYSISVMPALAKLPDNEFLRAMQWINKVIQNPIFFLCFLGPIVSLPYVTFQSIRTNTAAGPWIFSATLIYILGVFGITALFNVPLNRQIENISLAQTGMEEIRSIREQFEGPWNKWHRTRTMFSLLAFACLIISLKK